MRIRTAYQTREGEWRLKNRIAESPVGIGDSSIDALPLLHNYCLPEHEIRQP